MMGCMSEMMVSVFEAARSDLLWLLISIYPAKAPSGEEVASTLLDISRRKRSGRHLVPA